MNHTNRENLEQRFDDGENVLDYFETNIVLSIDRLADLATLLNLSALARETNLNVQTLQTKIRRRTPLTGDETRRIIEALKRYHLTTVQ
ncbi:MAG: hypothetical protein LC641_13505 [Spirochaeta sp.]|nr:hypothetical protein [Spirochaeta sp.]